ncbi:FeoA family protein [Kiritimatiellaeota bacterium B1221]|nr:FeoA family protein [Kiritimatiellaeota bacterium B1221]
MQADSTLPLKSLRLRDLSPGSCCVVTDMGLANNTARLKAMGICLGRTLEVLKAGDPLIVKVYGTRIGLSARLAEEILVRGCHGSQRCWEKMKDHG